jgi:7-cyano-7-deazaguanine synthase in queuosine biosynthesis
LSVETRERVLLFSGGMDSVACRYLWRPDHLLYFDVGTPYAAAEIARLPPHAIVLDLKGLAPLTRPDTILPMRNLVFAALASCYGGTIAIGATKEDRVLDKSVEFAALASQLLTFLWTPQWWTTGKTVDVILPLKHLTKYEILGALKAEGHDLERVALESFSCYYPQPSGACGSCKPCWRRWLAFAAHGVSSIPDCSVYAREIVLPRIQSGEEGREEEGRLLCSVLDVPYRPRPKRLYD